MLRTLPSQKALGLLAVLTAVAVAAGCVDAKGKFDDFGGRAGTIDASALDGPAGTLADISGTFLLACDPSFTPGSDPSDHVQFLMTYVMTRTGNTATLNASLQPLRVNPGGTYREPVGPPIVDNDIPVTPEGTFTAYMVGTIAGAANPVSGSNAPLDGRVVSTIVSADFVCGQLDGTVSGLDLAGSTIGAIRVTDTTPANLPEPVAGCPSSQPVDAGVDAPVPTDAPDDAPDPA